MGQSILSVSGPHFSFFTLTSQTVVPNLLRATLNQNAAAPTPPESRQNAAGRSLQSFIICFPSLLFLKPPRCMPGQKIPFKRQSESRQTVTRRAGRRSALHFKAPRRSMLVLLNVNLSARRNPRCNPFSAALKASQGCLPPPVPLAPPPSSLNNSTSSRTSNLSLCLESARLSSAKVQASQIALGRLPSRPTCTWRLFTHVSPWRPVPSP